MSLKKWICFSLALGWCAMARAQISPGPLARAHAQLEGVSKCSQCHDFGAGSRSFKCLDCHSEIRRRLEAGAGFHSHAYKPSPGQTDCAHCHMEHNGQGFALIRLDRKMFDHAAQTGFTLEGKHRQQACESCHNEKKIASPSREGIKLKDLNRTFLGLRRECASCHEDKHRGELGGDCKSCHSQDAWKPAAGFNHSRTPFPLTGLHQAVACQKCHTQRPGDTAVLFKRSSAASCQGCHTDPHRGAFQETKFRGSCETCHTTSGWKGTRPASGFDHSITKFALLGKHAAAACSACHKTSDFHRPIPHGLCRECHEDAHGGQFAARAAGSDCAACHNETAFKPARFDRETHQLSAFPLEGKHATLECADCHQPGGKLTVYVTRKLICSACHADSHGGEFAAAPLSNRCDLCHTTKSFQPATFDVARHAKTRFALTGRHGAVACASCHKPLATTMASMPAPVPAKVTNISGQPRQYRIADQTCNGCHADPHRTSQERPAKVSCETCHVTDDWKSVRPFDHAATHFQLDGAHAMVKCIQCHAPSPKVNSAARIAPDFASATGACGACHQRADVHAGQFRIGREEDCSVCHSSSSWKPSGFSHERTRFALDVAHRNVECQKCHKSRDENGKLVRIFRLTPLECVQCH